MPAYTKPSFQTLHKTNGDGKEKKVMGFVFQMVYLFILRTFCVLFNVMFFCSRALKSCGLGGAAHVKLVVEWDRETKE